MVEIVNIVASGDLQREVDLDQFLQDLEAATKEYSPEVYPGLRLRFKENGPLLTVYRSGSYVIMGAKTYQAIDGVFTQLQESFGRLGVVIDPTAAFPHIQNIICKGDLGREVNLSALAVGLELENVEYEPEQSPFLYFWPDEYDCVLSIPANGQVVITGIQTKEDAEAAFDHLRDQINVLLGDS